MSCQASGSNVRIIHRREGKHPTIPYETDEQLERIIYQDILQEAASTADARYCFIGAVVRALDDSGRYW
jgi:hypothetical protein